jgi:(R,R)-butanediol dehydrogenase/meso-butanediol dehydrogenase/diacetyl reductase
MFCSSLRPVIAGFAEYAVVSAEGSAKLPTSLSLADGALVEPLSVGLHGVALADLQPGSRVLVLGAGSVGLAAIFWARNLGAGKIVASSPSTKRAAMAIAMGADAFETLGDGGAARIADALGGPPDVVFECGGVVGLLGKSIELVKPNGTIVSLGFCTSPDPVLPSFATLKQVTIKFSFTYTLDEFQHCVDVYDRGHVDPTMMLSEPVSLSAFPTMLEALRAGSSHTKVQVDPWAK